MHRSVSNLFGGALFACLPWFGSSFGLWKDKEPILRAVMNLNTIQCHWMGVTITWMVHLLLVPGLWPHYRLGELNS